MRRNENERMGQNVVFVSPGLIPGTVLHDIVRRMTWTVCHMVSILTVYNMKWCLAQAWMAVTVTAQGIDKAFCGLWRVID